MEQEGIIMDIGIISLIISGIVASIQIINFVASRQAQSENKLSVFAKAVDIRIELDSIKEVSSSLQDKIIELDKKMDVLTERVDNEIRTTSKLLDKLDQELDKLK